MHKIIYEPHSIRAIKVCFRHFSEIPQDFYDQFDLKFEPID